MIEKIRSVIESMLDARRKKTIAGGPMEVDLRLDRFEDSTDDNKLYITAEIEAHTATYRGGRFDGEVVSEYLSFFDLTPLMELFDNFPKIQFHIQHFPEACEICDFQDNGYETKQRIKDAKAALSDESHVAFTEPGDAGWLQELEGRIKGQGTRPSRFADMMPYDGNCIELIGTIEGKQCSISIEGKCYRPSI